MKCNTCNAEFDPANLSEVAEHEHRGIEISEPVVGRIVAKKYTDEQSSNVDEVRYHDGDLSMDVVYRNGKRYRYKEVPRSIFDAAVEAPSIGSYLNRELKGAYRYEQVDRSSEP